MVEGKTTGQSIYIFIGAHKAGHDAVAILIDDHFRPQPGKISTR